jgi:hypothetical protein
MKVTDIKLQIMNDFAATYKNASPFVNSGEMWDFCMDTITSPMLLSNIIFANDLGIPPVKSLLLIWERKKAPKASFEFSGQESQWLGSLMGYLFKFILNYQDQKERCAVNAYGVRTATRFLDCPTIIEIEE